MPCYMPLQGYYSDSFTKSGKRKIVFKAELASVSTPMLIPCGQCIGCRLDRSRV